MAVPSGKAAASRAAQKAGRAVPTGAPNAASRAARAASQQLFIPVRGPGGFVVPSGKVLDVDGNVLPDVQAQSWSRDGTLARVYDSRTGEVRIVDEEGRTVLLQQRSEAPDDIDEIDLSDPVYTDPDGKPVPPELVEVMQYGGLDGNDIPAAADDLVMDTPDAGDVPAEAAPDASDVPPDAPAPAADDAAANRQRLLATLSRDITQIGGDIVNNTGGADNLRTVQELLARLRLTDPVVREQLLADPVVADRVEAMRAFVGGRPFTDPNPLPGAAADQRGLARLDDEAGVNAVQDEDVGQAARRQWAERNRLTQAQVPLAAKTRFYEGYADKANRPDGDPGSTGQALSEERLQRPGTGGLLTSLMERAAGFRANSPQIRSSVALTPDERLLQVDMPSVVDSSDVDPGTYYPDLDKWGFEILEARTMPTSTPERAITLQDEVIRRQQQLDALRSPRRISLLGESTADEARLARELASLKNELRRIGSIDPDMPTSSLDTAESMPILGEAGVQNLSARLGGMDRGRLPGTVRMSQRGDAARRAMQGTSAAYRRRGSGEFKAMVAEELSALKDDPQMQTVLRGIDPSGIIDFRGSRVGPAKLLKDYAVQRARSRFMEQFGYDPTAKGAGRASSIDLPLDMVLGPDGVYTSIDQITDRALLNRPLYGEPDSASRQMFDEEVARSLGPGSGNFPPGYHYLDSEGRINLPPPGGAIVRRNLLPPDIQDRIRQLMKDRDILTQDVSDFDRFTRPGAVQAEVDRIDGEIARLEASASPGSQPSAPSASAVPDDAPTPVPADVVDDVVDEVPPNAVPDAEDVPDAATPDAEPVPDAAVTPDVPEPSGVPEWPDSSDLPDDVRNTLDDMRVDYDAAIEDASVADMSGDIPTADELRREAAEIATEAQAVANSARRGSTPVDAEAPTAPEPGQVPPSPQPQPQPKTQPQPKQPPQPDTSQQANQPSQPDDTAVPDASEVPPDQQKNQGSQPQPQPQPQPSPQPQPRPRPQPQPQPPGTPPNPTPTGTPRGRWAWIGNKWVWIGIGGVVGGSMAVDSLTESEAARHARMTADYMRRQSAAMPTSTSTGAGLREEEMLRRLQGASGRTRRSTQTAQNPIGYAPF